MMPVLTQWMVIVIEELTRISCQALSPGVGYARPHG